MLYLLLMHILLNDLTLCSYLHYTKHFNNCFVHTHLYHMQQHGLKVKEQFKHGQKSKIMQPILLKINTSNTLMLNPKHKISPYFENPFRLALVSVSLQFGCPWQLLLGLFSHNLLCVLQFVELKLKKIHQSI